LKSQLEFFFGNPAIAISIHGFEAFPGFLDQLTGPYQMAHNDQNLMLKLAQLTELIEGL